MTDVQPKSCFVVSPIGDEGSETRNHADWLYHEIIEYVLERYFPGKFTVTRADKIHDPGMIDAQIIGHLLDDDLVIADMSMLNANAFYEMGIRHMKEKPVIHMFRKGEVIPFDVRLYRAIPFHFGSPADLKNARIELQQAISAVLSPEYKPDNPVIRARGVQKLEEGATPEMSLLMQQLGTMESRLRLVESFSGVPMSPISPVPPGQIRDYIFRLTAENATEEKRSMSRAIELSRQYLTSISAHIIGDGRLLLTAPVTSSARLRDYIQAVAELPYIKEFAFETVSP